MSALRHTIIDSLIALTQRRFGTGALRRAVHTPAASWSIPTNIPALDHALSCGGLPRGRLTELLGAPTSGMSTLALMTIAAAQSSGDIAVYFDLSCTFDAVYAAACGVDLDSLLLVRPDEPPAALPILEALVRHAAAGVIVLDSSVTLLAARRGAALLSAALRRLRRPLSESPCSVVMLTPLAGGEQDRGYSAGSLVELASLRLLVSREHWLELDQRMPAIQCRVDIIKNRLAYAGGQVSFTLSFATPGNGA